MGRSTLLGIRLFTVAGFLAVLPGRLGSQQGALVILDGR